MEISDIKLVYSEVKYFKSLYTQINKSEYIIFHAKKEGTVYIEFYSPMCTPYYILRGELSGNTEFIKWINQNNIICKLSLEEIKTIKSEKKADCVSIIYDENSFTFKSTDNSITVKNDVSLKDEIETRNIYNSHFITSYILLPDFFQDDICEIFLENEKPTTKRTDEKVLEIPTKKIMSTIKDINSGELLLDDRTNPIKKFVGLKFVSDDLGLSLTEIFATV